MAETRLKIAVFIDFDNIEIGVKTTLGGHFDVGAVLEAIKERGEVVTKIAYGDWTRAGDYSRSLTQHAIHMVQRNLTPGGDKNGADINLALDALEMAFTHSHINAFVIVGGDSDFMALVEKLKQYDRKVFVVGGRAFTSTILQRNCTEFIAYENLVGGSARKVGRGGKTGEASVEKAVPLIRRALKVLADREVSPQLGVLKSTLLQLDSTFSEREYGASTFRDFVQRLARGGYVTLKGTDRNIYVELRDGDPASAHAALPPSREGDTHPVDGDAGAPLTSTGGESDGGAAVSTTSAAVTPVAEADGQPIVAAAVAAPTATQAGSGTHVSAPSERRPMQRITDEPKPSPEPRQSGGDQRGSGESRQPGESRYAGAAQPSGAHAGGSHAASAQVQERSAGQQAPSAPVTGPQSPAAVAAAAAAGTAGSATGSVSQAELLRLVLDVFQRPGAVARWPLYLRQVKQLLRTADESFDERRFGFSGIVEALRYCQREGVFRLDRDRQGVLRVFPGPVLQRTAAAGGPTGHDASESAAGTTDGGASEPTAQGLFPTAGDTDERRAGERTDERDVTGDRAGGETPLFDAATDAAESPAEPEPAPRAAEASAPRGRKRTPAKAEKAEKPVKSAKNERAEKSEKTEKPVKKTAAAAKAAPRAAKATRGGRKGTRSGN